VKIHKSILWLNIFVVLILVININLMYVADRKMTMVMLNLGVILGIIGATFWQLSLVGKCKMKLSEQINRFMGITDSLKEGTNNLSKRTSDQAASLEETASTMEEITATVKQNGEHARLAASLTNQAQNVAQEGTQLSKEVQGAMDEISQSSNKISDIVGLVEEIAFQTNILAINAAIEAAKAGEVGKGFAVVAIEVRDLAQRSSNAAKEIKNLIDNSIAKVEKGSGLVVLSNQNLLGIAEGIQKVADIMGDVSSATNEQFTAINQISDTVIQLDTATQDNTSLVDSLTNSSDQLKNIVSGLNSVVTAFLPSDKSAVSDKKTIVNKIGIKKPEAKKPVVKKTVAKVNQPKKLVPVPEHQAGIINSTMSATKDGDKPVVVEKLVKTTVKKVQRKGGDDIVESILSRDPNFFESGEDF